METKELMDAFEEFKGANTARWKQLMDRTQMLEATLKRFNGAPSGEERVRVAGNEVKAFGKFIRMGDDASYGELKAMSVDSNVDGGFLVLPELSKELYRTARDVSPLRQFADVQSIATGDAWEQIINPDRSDTAWAAEREARPIGENAKLKMVRIPLQENFANIPVTQKLLDDSDVNVGEFVLTETGLSFGEDEAIAFATGDGLKRPRGFLTYDVSTDVDAVRPWGTVQVVKTGADGAFATATAAVSPADVLADTFYSLKAAYRKNAIWLMNSLTAAAVRKMKDPEGRFIWRDSLNPAQLPALLGRPVAIDENMPNHTTADALAIALADWNRAYVVVDRPGIKTLRDPYTSKPNVLFYSYVRVGGGIRDFRAIKFVQFGD